jgi:hypothetical protein
VDQPFSRAFEPRQPRLQREQNGLKWSGKNDHIHQQDAKQGKPAQDINNLNALALLNRCNQRVKVGLVVPTKPPLITNEGG